MRLSLLTVACLLTGCLGAPVEVDDSTSAIIGGTTDTGDPAVVLVFAQPPGSNTGSLCTGEVISPHVVLTAAHCVSPEEVGANAKFTVFTGNDLDQAQASQLLTVQETHFNADWSPNNLGAGHDVGVVILKNPTTIKPLPFMKSPITQAMIGQAVRLVGYGLSDAKAQTGAGLKRQTSTVLSDFDNVLLAFNDGAHETCNGDSGGPALMKVVGVETIVGVTSFGDAACAQGGYDTRIDAEQAFIQPFVDQYDPATVNAGSTTPDPDTIPTPTPTGSGDGSGDGSAGSVGGGGSEATAQAQIGQSCARDTDCASNACGVGSQGTLVCVTNDGNGNNGVIGGCSVAGSDGRGSALGLGLLLLVCLGLGRGFFRRVD